MLPASRLSSATFTISTASVNNALLKDYGGLSSIEMVTLPDNACQKFEERVIELYVPSFFFFGPHACSGDVRSHYRFLEIENNPKPIEIAVKNNQNNPRCQL